MANFVDDDLDLPNFPKADVGSSGKPAVNDVRAGDMNNIRQALLDIKTKVRTGVGTPTARQILAGAGLSGGGDLTSDRTLSLANSGVTAGNYDASSFAIDAKGRITSARVDYMVSAKTAGAMGDDTTDDHAALVAAIASAKTLGARLHLPGDASTRYKISKYLDVADARGLRITGNGAVIHYASDDTTVFADSVALTDNQARSAILLRYCTDTVIEGITFQGGTSPAFDTVNLGVAIYETHCQGTKIIACTSLDGNTLHAGDAQTNTANTGDSLAVTAGVVMLTSSTALFRPGHVGHTVSISSATNNANNGTFVISGYISPTQVIFKNAGGISETTAALRWEIDDGDRNTWIDDCRLERYRGPMTIASHSRITRLAVRQPMSKDYAGVPSSFSVNAGITTMSAVNGAWDGSVVGKYVRLAGSTSGANDGPAFLITAATPKSRYAPASLTYANAGVTEAGNHAIATPGTYWIMGGEKVGKGAGAGAISVAAGVVTFHSAAAAFVGADVGKIVRIANATSSANNGAFIITAVTDSTHVTFTNTVAVSEAFANTWGIDGWDAAGPAGGAYGSTACIYIYAGREDIEVAGCVGMGIRKAFVKASGSSSPIRNISVHHNTLTECGALFVGGADDAQEHTALNVDFNTMIDCGTGRPGWGDGTGMTFLGCKGSSANGNVYYYTRPPISMVDGRASNAGLYAIIAARYVPGKTQPLEDFSARGNKFIADRVNTTPGIMLSASVHVERCGQTSYWGRAGVTLTNNAGVMTLQDGSAAFSQDLVGAPIQIYGPTSGGNAGTFIVTAVTGTSSLTYANGAGVTEVLPAAGSSYRIKRPNGARGGGCQLQDNYCDGAAAFVVETISCLAPDVRGNIGNNIGGVNDSGSAAPLYNGCREIGAFSSSAWIRLSSTTSWPIVYDNFITNGDLSGGGTITGGALTPEKPAAVRRDMGVGVDSGTVVDHPLLGKVGRAARNYGSAELMIAFGSELVEGDTFSLNGAAYTYTDAPAPAYPKFHTLAQLIAISTGSGYTAADYGSRFMTPVVTGHMAVHLTAANATVNQGYIDTVNILNPTALVIPRNDIAGGESIQYSRGEATAGPLDRKLAIWSPLASRNGLQLSADNATAAAVLAGGWFAPPVAGDTGACKVVQFNTTASGTTGGGTQEEYRWELS